MNDLYTEDRPKSKKTCSILAFVVRTMSLAWRSPATGTTVCVRERFAEAVSSPSADPGLVERETQMLMGNDTKKVVFYSE